MIAVHLSALLQQPSQGLEGNQPAPRSVEAVRWLASRHLLHCVIGSPEARSWMELYSFPAVKLMDAPGDLTPKPKLLICGLERELNQPWASHIPKLMASPQLWETLAVILPILPIDHRIRQDPFNGKGSLKPPR